MELIRCHSKYKPTAGDHTRERKIKAEEAKKKCRASVRSHLERSGVFEQHQLDIKTLDKMGI